ncbi:putative glucose-6-phosphate isomerase [Aeromicrobium marinum DSM 15272]|uniref:Glucose-6-phosphate isomerase n=1 Tax=Aeromicrobium marinum DSM 15272 TaxID=585531 RepID=E2SA34_9ACTN|nr:glucose-6-phosphate isomerase [Aeromicrobium marinum]EFQ84108.1 putative glucose-6-phosphate isomerase [Aeromicrobium marinum DSM 15272]
MVAFTAPVRSYERVLRRLVDESFASRLGSHDASLWGRPAAEEAARRLGWIDLARTSRPLLPRIASLRTELRDHGLDHVVLCGMGGSSLAPEVICRAAGVELTVVDSSHPDMVRTALADRLERAVVVVSSKSGGTVETDSARRAFEAAFTDAGLDPARHLVVVTDPGSPLDEQATAAGYRVFRADPNVGGRYSALTAFGLVPCGLAGVPLAALLEDAASVHAEFFGDSVENRALRLGTLLGVAADNDVEKLVLLDHTGAGLGDWIEQLVAESTGKRGRGVLPVVVADASAPEIATPLPDTVTVTLGDADGPVGASGYAASIDLPLGAQMLLWEVATSVAGEILGINPFDQPDVESAKAAARGLLEGSAETSTADFTDERIEVHGSSTGDVGSAVAELLDRLGDTDYLAVQVYLDRWEHADFAAVRDRLARRTGRPVTFGWGPRFLHSTGQYHKGGTPNGVFLQITGEPVEDLPVPGREFTFGSFLASQAEGDAQVLRGHDRPVLRLHLTDVPRDLDRLAAILA